MTNKKTLFNDLDNTAEAEVFDNGKFCGLEIRWSLKNFGFGLLTIGYDKKEKIWVTDTDDMDAKSLTVILEIAAPSMAKMLVRLDTNNV